MIKSLAIAFLPMEKCEPLGPAKTVYNALNCYVAVPLATS